MNENFFWKDFSQNSSRQQRVTFPDFGSKSGSKNFSKKKLFFLAMFKNEITTFKKKIFSTKNFFFRFFFKKKFSKMAVKSDWTHVFSWIFFSTDQFFLLLLLSTKTKLFSHEEFTKSAGFIRFLTYLRPNSLFCPGNRQKIQKTIFFFFLLTFYSVLK